MAGIRLLGTLVGVIGATIVRGEREGDVGGVVVEDIDDMDGTDAESGLQESLRRQLSLQYNKLLLGVVIWFSHMAQKFKKLAISNSVSSADVDLLAPFCPEPNLENVTVAPEVPRRCKAGRVDLDLET